MTAARALESYRQLLGKVDAKFEEVRGRHPGRFRCGAGCHGCCLPGLTVSPVEAASIRAFLHAHPERRREVEALAAANPHGGRSCRFLTAGGACAIYEVRPVVCRSHGAPLKVRREEGSAEVARDVCPLNFEGTPLEALAEADFIHLDTLNTLLALINAHFQPGDGATRTPLTPDALLG